MTPWWRRVGFWVLMVAVVLFWDHVVNPAVGLWPGFLLAMAIGLVFYSIAWLRRRAVRKHDAGKLAHDPENR